MIVREAMVVDPRVAAASDPVREVAELLSRPNVRSVLVVDGQRLVGCVTAELVVRAVARGEDLRSAAAADVADPDVTTISPDAPLDDALHLMAERDLDRIAVTEEGRLLGILPREPILRRIAEDEPPAGDEESPVPV